MQGLTHRAPLRLGLSQPVPGSIRIGRSRPTAGSGCGAVKDRPIERRIDDVVVGHACPLLNTPNLNAAPVNGYGAKTGALQ